MPLYADSGKELSLESFGLLLEEEDMAGLPLLRCCCVLGMAVAVGPQIQSAPNLQKAHLLSRGLGGVREKKAG